MGIGVSYTGYDGRTQEFNADGAPEIGSPLANLMGASKKSTEMLRARMASGAPMVGKTYGGKSGDATTMPGGSVVKGNGGLCLRGEEFNPLVQGVRLYSSVNGSKGFHSINEIDPNIDGPLVGNEGDSSLQPDGQRRGIDSRGGWRIPVTRCAMDVRPSLEMKCNEVTIVEFKYDLIISEAGRVCGRTEEVEQWRKSFFVLNEQGSVSAQGSSQYGVKAFWDSEETDKPMLEKLCFGAEEYLATYDQETDKFLCNYDENGNLVSNPPVKIVSTGTCSYNPIV